MQNDLKQHVTRLKAQYGSDNREGFIDTPLPGVRLFWANGPVSRAPLSYDPGIAIIVSGEKIGFFEDGRIPYGPGQYLAVGLPLFFECETRASADAPLIGLFLSADLGALRDLAQSLRRIDVQAPPAKAGLGIEPLPLTAPMEEAATRLARQLITPAEAAILGPGTVRELFFHALRDRHGTVLLNQTRSNRPEARIAAILRDLEATPDMATRVDQIADGVGMSTATLHRHFKEVTGLSPLQYIKRKRLMRAKSLLTFGDLSVSQTAHAVGYASPAQFSREFSAYFGKPPSKAAELAYPV